MSTGGGTPWGTHRIALGGSHLLFGRMHEDASVDEVLLADAGRVFAIASAGDTALRLASRGRQVTAVDVPFVSAVPRPLGRHLRRRLRAGFAAHPNRHNPYAWRLLLGIDPPGDEAPPSRPVQDLVVELGEAASFLERQPAGSFDGFTLSNILDGPDRRYRTRLAVAVRHAGRPTAPVVLRTLREARNQDEAQSALRDRALLWGAIVVTTAEDLIDRVDWS